MPTTRTKKTRGRVIGAGGITQAAYYYYTWGPFFEAEDYEKGKNETELKAFWKKNRAAIMEKFFAENKESGQRPWPVWKWELTEPRLKTNAKQKVWDQQREVYDLVETDFEYLKRLGLLEPWELNA